MMKRSVLRRGILGLVALTSVAVLVSGVGAQSDDGELRETEHIKIENPGQLTAEKAEQIYQSISEELTTFYAMSESTTARRFRKWRRYNKAPYLSATQGNRYVNDFANAKAKGYDSMSRGVKMPAGATFAKDSFAVTKEGEVFGAAPFIMEKLAPGKSPRTADWRYAEILPDGSFAGDSAGDNARDMDYCHACHKIKTKYDYIYYVPRKYRP